MKKYFSYLRYNYKLFLIVFAGFTLQTICGSFLLFHGSASVIQSEIDAKIDNIKKDITFNNGHWNMDTYNKNPALLGVYPLYLFTTDGFVLDRRAPIHGFLDLSDYKRLLTFDKPQTYTSITKQTRRIYAKTIYNGTTPIGVIAVSYYNPSEEILEKIDKQLINNANNIYSQITMKDNIINIAKVNLKKIDYDISFVVIDRFNTILLKTPNVDNTDRIPNFIDPSYVKTQLNLARHSVVKDTETGELFMITRSAIKNNTEQSFGIVIIGSSLNPILQLLSTNLIWSVFINVILALLLTILIGYLLKTKKLYIHTQNMLPQQIAFNQKKGILTIDGEDITIPYATNQYYLLKALFSQPSKRWETDELLEQFGEDAFAANSRKVYDAMISINKKVTSIIPDRLILTQNKTYQLNSQLLASKL